MKLTLTLILLFGALVGCAPTIPPEALQFQPDTLANRQLESRKYEIKSEKELLTASNSVLQDMGFNLDESAMPLGLIVASKNRDATNMARKVASVVFAAFGKDLDYEKDQKIRASLVTKPATGNGFIVRVTFQRVVWDQKGRQVKNEQVSDPMIYQEFFDKLSKSIFLQAQNVE
jgi:hypothetical protein